MRPSSVRGGAAMRRDVTSINREHKRRQQILIADDSEMNRSILADMLGEEYDILEAENGVEAVSAIQKYRMEIDLVLLDIVMPEMDGFEVLTVMNRNNWIEDIPVIMLTAMEDKESVLEGISLGISDYVLKPFAADDLLSRIRRVLENQGQDREGPAVPSLNTQF